MKISFSYNQICQIQIATIRQSECYELVRSYLGIPVGAHFDEFDLIDTIIGDTFNKYPDEFGDLQFSIRGTEFGLNTVLHACRTLIAIQNIQLALNALELNNKSSLKHVREVVKNAKLMIDAVEW